MSRIRPRISLLDFIDLNYEIQISYFKYTFSIAPDQLHFTIKYKIIDGNFVFDSNDQWFIINNQSAIMDFLHDTNDGNEGILNYFMNNPSKFQEFRLKCMQSIINYYKPIIEDLNDMQVVMDQLLEIAK